MMEIPEIKVKKRFELEAQEELAILKKMQNKLIIGIPKENSKEEKRIPLTPEAIGTLIDTGYKVYIEDGAGKGSSYTNEDFESYGAKIIYDKKELFAKSSIITKISHFAGSEIKFLGNNKTIISALNLSFQRHEYLTALQSKHTTALAFEYYTDNRNFNPFLHVIGEIIGGTAIMIAAELLSNINQNGKGLLLGGVTGTPPSNVIVLGSDISARQSIKIALGLGACVKVFDNSLEKLIKIRELFGNHIYTSIINYRNLKKTLADADVIINTIQRGPNEPYAITVEMIKQMKKGSVIIDLKIDSGSIIETSKITTFENPFYDKFGIIHYCVPNIASRVARTSSQAISNVLTPILKRMYEVGGLATFLRMNNSFKNSIYLYNGILVNASLAKLFSMKYTNIEILLDTF